MNGKLSTVLSAEDHDSQEGVGAVLGVVVVGHFFSLHMSTGGRAGQAGGT